jgi:hypothetical protein
MRRAAALAALLFVASPAAAEEERPKNRLFFELLGGARQLLLERIQSVPNDPQAHDPTFHDDVHPMSTGVPVYGGGFAIGGGYRPTEGHGGAAVAHYEMGSTNYALRTHTLFLGGEWNYVFGRFSTVLGARLGYLAIVRATDGPLIQHWGVGVNGGVSVDVFGWDGGTLFVRPEIDAMVIPHALIEARSLLWGGVVGCGVRF